MSVDVIQLTNLLANAHRITAHQDEIKMLRGEHFNIFSVLNMEHKENATHSAFLAELLNPEGSHKMGNLFLNHFLKTIQYPDELDVQTTTVCVEKHIGTRNDKEKTGGRVDIFIEDKNQNTICIENKIYAGDQPAQVERYVNFNKDKNTVYYLTLKGEEPSDASKGKLSSDQLDYYCISYSVTIIQWLGQCLKETVEQPILRETIRQYIHLIKKLSNQLFDSIMEKEVDDLIKKNYQAAKIIADNIYRVELNAAYSFMSDLKKEVETELGSGWIVSLDADLNTPWSGLTITYKDWDGINLKLEGSSRIPWTNTYYGIVAEQGSYNREQLLKAIASTSFANLGNKPTEGWPWWKFTNLTLDKVETRIKLFDPITRQELLNELSINLISLANECKDILINCKKLKG
jgi:hypothetical protein